MSERDKALLVALRRALLAALGAVEDAMGVPRSVVSKSARPAAEGKARREAPRSA